MTSEPELRIEDDPKPEQMMELQDRLYEFNDAVTAKADDGRYLTIFVRDEAGELRGGLLGWTWAGTLGIETLWVRDSERRRGLGTRLLAAAEAEAVRRGCHQAFVQTHSFQAPDFYPRRGWQTLAEVPGYPGDTTRMLFRKALGHSDGSVARS
jgi:GNAT superfamily N-acetyltransferase